MLCLPLVHVGRPDMVQLSGTTTLKTRKAIYSWTVLGFDICPEVSVKITSPTFSHPNSSKWCVELENDAGKLMMCFCLVSSSDSVPVTATIKASLVGQDGSKKDVYPAVVHNIKINEKSPRQCLTDAIDEKDLGEKWTFECEVCTLEVLTKDTSGEFDEDVSSAVAEDLEELLESKDHADITLSSGGVRLEAHRAILCARSPVFRAMLSHDTKEAREGLIEIPGVEPEVVEMMLRYMYTDKVEVSGDMTEQLLVVCDKYELQDAKLQCERELARQLTVDNAANTAACAIIYSCSSLQEVCVEFIKQNLEQVLGSKSWANIIDKHPKVVKTVTELVIKGSERCSSPPASCGSQSDVTCAGSEDTMWDSGYTHCQRKRVIYVWEIKGLKNWPQGREFVTSPSFWHPETLQWELRLYKREKHYLVYLKLVENKVGSSVRVDMSITKHPERGCNMYEFKDLTFEKGSESTRSVQWNVVPNFDRVTLKCEISMTCVLQQCVIAIKPVLQSVLTENLNSLLESGNFTDFKLCSGTVEMGVHRAILAARSPFFARILQSGSEESKVGQLELPDVKPEVLAEILLYIYTGKVKNLGDSTAELLSAAHKFELDPLKNECVTHMSGKLTVGNAVATAVCAIENKSYSLLNASLEFIQLHVKQVMGTAEWMEAIDRHPAAFKKICELVAQPVIVRFLSV